jgi:hypothetical protein
LKDKNDIELENRNLKKERDEIKNVIEVNYCLFDTLKKIKVDIDAYNLK